MCPTARYVSIALAVSMVLPPSAKAQEHLVTRTDIAAHLQAAADERASNQERVQRFLSGRIPASADGLDIQRRVVAGVAALSDDELRDLASRCRPGPRCARRSCRQELQGAGRRVPEQLGG